MARLVTKPLAAPSASGTRSFLDPDEVREALGNANLPIRAGRLHSSILEAKGLHDLRDYIKSPSFLVDHGTNKIGINIYGPADIRTDALALVAKMFVLGQSTSYYMSTHELVAAIDNGGEFRNTLSRTQNLFIDWFERDFKGGESPYTYYQRAAFEEFLEHRRQSELVTFFGSYCRWDEHKWWSQSFLTAFCDNVIDIKVSK